MSITIEQIVQIITAFGAVGAAFFGISTRGKISQLHISTNSKMDLLIAEIRKSSRAEGVLAGRAEQKAQPR